MISTYGNLEKILSEQEKVKDFIREYIGFCHQLVAQYKNSVSYKARMDELNIYSKRNFVDGMEFEIQRLCERVSILKIENIAIQKALTEAAPNSDFSFVEIVTSFYSGTVYLKYRGDLVDCLTAAELNRTVWTSDISQPGTFICLCAIDNILKWQNKQVDLLLTHHTKLLPLIDPIIFKRSPRIDSQGNPKEPNKKLTAILFMGIEGFSFIESNKAVLETITPEQINQYLFAFLQINVGRRILKDNPHLLKMVKEPAKPHRNFLLSDQSFIPAIISNLTFETMIKSGYQAAAFNLDVKNDIVVFTVSHADKLFIVRLQAYMKKFFEEELRYFVEVTTSGNKNLIIKSSLLDFAHFIKQHEIIPFQLKDLPSENATKPKVKFKKSHAKSRTKTTECVSNVAEQLEKSEKNCVTKIKQKFNVALWEKGLMQFFANITPYEITMHGAKDRSTFQFIVKLPPSIYFVVTNPKDASHKIKASDKTLRELLVKKLQEYNAMSVEIIADAIHVVPKQNSFTPSSKSLVNLFNAIVSQNTIAPAAPPVEIIDLPVGVKKIFDRLHMGYGYPIFLGSSLEDCIKRKLRILSQDEFAIDSSQVKKKDIDMVLFTDKAPVLNEFVRNPNARFNLYNATRELRKEIDDTHVDLLFVDCHLESVKQNILKRDFLHCTVFSDSAGRVFDLTGRGIAAIRDNLLATVRDPVKTFEDDPVCLLRAIKFILQGKNNVEAATNAAIKDWSSKNSKIDMERINKTLRSHLLNYDQTEYVKKLKEYGLVWKLFGINEDKPIEDIIRELRANHAKIVEISKDLTDYAAMVPLKNTLGHCFYVDSIYQHRGLGMRIIKTTDNMEFPIDPETGLAVAKDERNNLYHLQVPIVPKDAKNIVISTLDQVDEKQPLDIVRKEIKDGVTYIRERGSYIYPLDVTGRPFAKNQYGRCFIVNRPLVDSTASVANSYIFKSPTPQQNQADHEAKNTARR